MLSKQDAQRIIFTGASGVLGRAFQRQLPDLIYPSRAEFDVTNYDQMDAFVGGKGYQAIFHAAAFTSPPKIDAEPLKALETNVIGTALVVRLAMKHSLKLYYVSTDYVFRGDQGNYREEDELYPVNKYAWSKLAGECAVRLYDNSLIIRTTFGPVPFPYEKAFIDQWTSRESVDRIVAMIIPLLSMDLRGVVHVGGPRKTVYDYAVGLDPQRNIGKISTNEVAFKVPFDTSLDCSYYQSLIQHTH